MGAPLLILPPIGNLFLFFVGARCIVPAGKFQRE
jgi:hypothetical protein